MEKNLDPLIVWESFNNYKKKSQGDKKVKRYRVDLPLLSLESKDLELEYSDNGLK